MIAIETSLLIFKSKRCSPEYRLDDLSFAFYILVYDPPRSAFYRVEHDELCICVCTYEEGKKNESTLTILKPWEKSQVSFSRRGKKRGSIKNSYWRAMESRNYLRYIQIQNIPDCWQVPQQAMLQASILLQMFYVLGSFSYLQRN